ncbi:MAG TPA: hypothetical protein DEP84_01945 [Chloroflexi bacterium]|nr:hypothetical protein [Chloroflexota bacterium]
MRSTRTLLSSLALVALLLAGCGPAGLFTPETQPPGPPAPRAPAQLTPEVQVPVTATPEPLEGRPIYVLDPRDGDLVSQVLVVDPARRRVVRTFRARYTPDLVFSPDGRRLYVADSYSTQVIRGEQRDVLSVYDAVTGELLLDDRPVPDRLLYKVFPLGTRNLFLSPDGERLFVRKYGDPDVHRLRLAVLDAETLEMRAEYPACSDGELWSLPGRRLICVSRAVIQLIDPLTGATTHQEFLPPGRIVATAAAPAGDRLYVITNDVQVSVIDLTILPPRAIAQPVLLDAPPEAQVAPFQIALAPDGARLYLGFWTGKQPDGNLAEADEVWAFDTRTWARLGTFTPPEPAFNLAVSADGHQLYTVNPFERTLSIFDTATFQEVGILRDLGETPALIVVPRSR